MQSILSSNSDTVLEGDKYYWKLSKEVLIKSAQFWFEFQLHNKTWNCLGFVFTQFIDINIQCLTTGDHLFNVQAGIVGDNQRIFASLNAKRIEYYKNIYEVQQLIARPELESILLTNKVLYLFVEIKRQDVELKRQHVENVYKREKCKRKLESDYKELLLSGRNSDVTINVQKKIFKCHRGILGVRSPVFSAMVEHDMQGKNSGVVIVKDADPTSFQEFLLYIYTGSEEHLSWGNVIDLYKLGDKYAIGELKDLCGEHIKENITMENFCDFFLLSQQHNDSDLTDTLKQFFLKNSKKIVRSENWMKLLSENPIDSNVLITALADQ